jgi:beta-aspartyl-peptidase (threonine type)
MTKKSFTAILLVLFFHAMLRAQTKPAYALAIHGGAGMMKKENMSDEIQKDYLKILNHVLRVGDSILSSGGTCVDAVEQCIVIMEDSPLFNAGKGAVLTHEGIAELDASVMEGLTLKAGAVAAVRDVKNPIQLARRIMDHSEHVMLTGIGASKYYKEQGFKPVPNSYFRTKNRKKSLDELLKKERKETTNDKHGTVGCVALDIFGNVAAGTSTGGMMNKKYGRVGDSPIIGAGTYANNLTGAFSCTGHGEYYIRLGFSRDISALIEYRNLSIEEACRVEIEKLTQLGGVGGVIGIDKNGNIALEFNTSGMFRGFLKSNGEKEVAIFK